MLVPACSDLSCAFPVSSPSLLLIVLIVCVDVLIVLMVSVELLIVLMVSVELLIVLMVSVDVMQH